MLSPSGSFLPDKTESDSRGGRVSRGGVTLEVGCSSFPAFPPCFLMALTSRADFKSHTATGEAFLIAFVKEQSTKMILNVHFEKSTQCKSVFMSVENTFRFKITER